MTSLEAQRKRHQFIELFTTNATRLRTYEVWLNGGSVSLTGIPTIRGATIQARPEFDLKIGDTSHRFFVDDVLDVQSPPPSKRS